MFISNCQNTLILSQENKKGRTCLCCFTSRNPKQYVGKCKWPQIRSRQKQHVLLAISVTHVTLCTLIITRDRRYVDRFRHNIYVYRKIDWHHTKTEVRHKRTHAQLSNGRVNFMHAALNPMLWQSYRQTLSQINSSGRDLE